MAKNRTTAQVATSGRITLTVRLTHAQLRVDTTHEGYANFRKNLVAGTEPWIDIEASGILHTVRCDSVLAFEAKPESWSPPSKKKSGFTATDLAAVMKIEQRTAARLVQKLRSQGTLEMISERRIAASDANFEQLDLSNEQRTKIREIERERTSSST